MSDLRYNFIILLILLLNEIIMEILNALYHLVLSLYTSDTQLLANPGLLVPIALGAASLASTLFTNHANKKRQEEMNEYNSPAAQIARYKVAGVNPGYGSGISSGNQSSVVQAAAPDVSAAVDAGSKYVSYKLMYQDLKNKGLENARLSEIVRNQKLNNDLLDRTLDYRVQSEIESLRRSRQFNDYAYQANPLKLTQLNFGNDMLESNSKIAAIKRIWTEALAFAEDKFKGNNPLKLDFLKGQAALSLQNQLLRQNDVMNPLHYQLADQRFSQNEIMNPLLASVAAQNAFGVRSGDPLIMRLMAQSQLSQGNGMFENPLLPYAAGYEGGKGFLDLLKLFANYKAKAKR